MGSVSFLYSYFHSLFLRALGDVIIHVTDLKVCGREKNKERLKNCRNSSVAFAEFVVESEILSFRRVLRVDNQIGHTVYTPEAFASGKHNVGKLEDTRNVERE